MCRQFTKGSWTFSDQDHGWAVSDCTAEALTVHAISNKGFYMLHTVLFIETNYRLPHSAVSAVIIANAPRNCWRER